MEPSSPSSSLTLSLSPINSSSDMAGHLFQVQPMKPEERGIRLIQLLLACGRHASARDLRSADRCLYFISALSSPSGDPMQRLSHHLAAALAAVLLRLLRCPGLLSILRRDLPQARRSLMLSSSSSFSRALPYIPFSHAVITHTLLRSVGRRRSVHVISLGRIDPAGLYVHLLQAFSRLPSCPESVKITCVTQEPDCTDDWVGEALAEHVVDSLGEPFLFHFQHVVVTPALSDLAAAMNIDVVEDNEEEALALVSVRATDERFLSAMIIKLRPDIIVAVEEEFDGNVSDMEERVVECMRHYGALFDSVEAAVRSGAVLAEERAAVELEVGREMEGALAAPCDAGEGGRWAEGLGMAGFDRVAVCDGAVDEGRRAAAAFRGEGYGVAVRGGCAVISWHQQPMYAVSVWKRF